MMSNHPGIVITVSHDRYFLDRTVDRIFAFEAGGHLTHIAEEMERVRLGSHKKKWTV